MHIGLGTEFSLKIARFNESKDIEILNNILNGIKNALKLFKQLDLEKDNLRRIYVKTEKSESLPIYTHLT